MSTFRLANIPYSGILYDATVNPYETPSVRVVRRALMQPRSSDLWAIVRGRAPGEDPTKTLAWQVFGEMVLKEIRRNLAN